MCHSVFETTNPIRPHTCATIRHRYPPGKGETYRRMLSTAEHRQRRVQSPRDFTVRIVPDDSVDVRLTWPPLTIPFGPHRVHRVHDDRPHEENLRRVNCTLRTAMTTTP